VLAQPSGLPANAGRGSAVECGQGRGHHAPAPHGGARAGGPPMRLMGEAPVICTTHARQDLVDGIYYRGGATRRWWRSGGAVASRRRRGL
jgi:hypothetical protein